MFDLIFFRYSYEGLSEDMHTWFFLYDEKVALDDYDDYGDDYDHQHYI